MSQEKQINYDYRCNFLGSYFFCTFYWIIGLLQNSTKSKRNFKSTDFKGKVSDLPLSRSTHRFLELQTNNYYNYFKLLALFLM